MRSGPPGRRVVQAVEAQESPLEHPRLLVPGHLRRRGASVVVRWELPLHGECVLLEARPFPGRLPGDPRAQVLVPESRVIACCRFDGWPFSTTHIGTHLSPPEDCWHGHLRMDPTAISFLRGDNWWSCAAGSTEAPGARKGQPIEPWSPGDWLPQPSSRRDAGGAGTGDQPAGGDQPWPQKVFSRAPASCTPHGSLPPRTTA